VLPAAARMRARTEFTVTVRGGARATSPALVVHLAHGQADALSPHVGLIVTRSVGGAVERNRVRRRLRHLMRERLDRLPTTARVVVRANPVAASRSSAELGADLDLALDRAVRRAASR